MEIVPIIRKTIAIGLVCTAIGGCEKSKDAGRSQLNSVKAEPGITRIVVVKSKGPTFRKVGSIVQVIAPEGKLLGSFNLDQLVDIDRNLATVTETPEEQDRDLAIIETAITGAFEMGLYERNTSRVGSSETQGLIKMLTLTKPFKVHYLEDGSRDYYNICALMNGSIITACSVDEEASGLSYGSIYFFSDLSKAPIRVDGHSPLSRQGAFDVARLLLPKYSQQAFRKADLERVKIRADAWGTAGAFGYLWRFHSSNPGYFIAVTGKLYRASREYSLEELNRTIKLGKHVSLIELQ